MIRAPRQTTPRTSSPLDDAPPAPPPPDARWPFLTIADTERIRDAWRFYEHGRKVLGEAPCSPAERATIAAERDAVIGEAPTLRAYVAELEAELEAARVAAHACGATIDTRRPEADLAVARARLGELDGGARGPIAMMRRYRAPLARVALRLHLQSIHDATIARVLNELAPMGVKKIDRRRIGEWIDEARASSHVVMRGRSPLRNGNDSRQCR